MADNDVILKIKVLADATQAAAGLDKAAGNTSKFGRGLKKAALPAAAAGAAILALGKHALDSASQLQQAEGGVEKIFGKYADTVKENADKAAVAMGLSAAQYDQYAALVGGALQKAGFSVKDSVGETNTLMQRAADLAATYGYDTADAVEAINAAVSRGEFDPLEKFNVTLNANAVAARMAADGTDKLTGAAFNAAKKQATLAEIYAQSANTAGQYAEEADSAAGAQQTMTSQVENASAAMGQILLPVVASMAGALGTMAEWTQKNATTVQVLVGAIAAFSAVILILNGVLKAAAVLQGAYNGVLLLCSKAALGTRIQLIALTAAEKAQALALKVVAVATKAWAVATKLLSAAWAASPIGIVVLIILAIAAALVIAYRRSATFRAFVDAMWAGIQKAARATWQVIKVVWDAILNAGKAAFNWLKANWQYALAGVLMGPFGIALVYIVKNFDKVKQVARAVFNAIKSAARAVANAVRSVFTAAFRAITAVIRAQVNGIRTALNLIRATARVVTSFIRSAFSAAWRFVLSVARSQFAAVKTVIAGVKAAVGAVTDKVGSLARKFKDVSVPGTIKTAVDKVGAAIDAVVRGVQSLIDKLRSIPTPHINWPSPPKWLSKLPGFSAMRAPTTPTVPTLRAAPTLLGARVGVGGASVASSGGGGLVININGALDPEGTARAVARVVRGHERRIGVRTS